MKKENEVTPRQFAGRKAKGSGGKAAANGKGRRKGRRSGRKSRKKNRESAELIKERERRVEEARKFNLLSNVFMSVALQDKEACQHVLRILLDMPELTVKEVRAQYRISKITAHDAILDILAEDKDKRLLNIEIQRGDTIDHARRIRFYGAMVDSEYLAKGCGYGELPDVFILYISETDIWKSGKTFYEVKKYLSNPSSAEGNPESISYEDGQRIFFVNAEVNDGSEKAALMEYFKTADPDDRSQGALSERVHFLKSEEGGYKEMCKITDKIYNEGVENGRKSGLADGRKKGLAEGIAASIAICRQYCIPDIEIIRNLTEKFSLSEKEARKYLTKAGQK